MYFTVDVLTSAIPKCIAIISKKERAVRGDIHNRLRKASQGLVTILVQKQSTARQVWDQVAT